MRLLLTFMVMSVVSVLADSIIPDTRLYNWGGFTGVEGGIPNVTTVYDDGDADGLTDSLEIIDNTGATVVRTAFQTVLDNCPSNQVIGVPSGVFLLVGSAETANLTLDSDGVVMRGRGPGATTLVCKGDAGGFATFYVNKSAHDYDFNSVTKYNISDTTLESGASNITTSISHALNVGDYVWIDQRTNTGYIFLRGSSGPCNFCAGANRYADERVYGMMTRVVAVPAGNQLTIQPPVVGMGFQSTNSPQIMSANGVVQRFGFESMTFSNASTSVTPYWFHLVGTANSWFTNVEFAVSHRRFIHTLNTFRNSYVNLYCHHGNGTDWTSAYGADRAYAIYLGYGSSFNRVEDSIFFHLHFAVSFEGAIAGNVTYGNFHTNQVFSDRYASQPNMGHHGPAATGNLWEHNNVNSTFTFDEIWGAGNAYTLFRNRVKLDVQHDGVDVSQIAFCIDMAEKHYFYNIVGNVLGRSTDDKVFLGEGDGVTEPTGIRAIYRFGYPDAFDNWSYSTDDEGVTNTMILKANYDLVTAGVPSAQSVGSTNLLDSILYGSTKPTWWGISNWPSIGPDKTPTVENSNWVPAMGRFYALNGAGVTNWLGVLGGQVPVRFGSGKARGGISRGIR